MFKIICLVFCSFFTIPAAAQALTVNDFKLTLDDYAAPDVKGNILVLTKEQLLKAKQLHTNFSWATIKSTIFYFSSTTSTDSMPVQCEADKLCPALQTFFKRCGPGSFITIIPFVENKQHKNVEWGSLSILIK